MQVKLVVCWAALLAAVAWLLDMRAREPSSSLPPDTLSQLPSSLPAPLFCSAGLMYEPDLSLSDFTAKYKVDCPSLILLQVSMRLTRGMPTRDGNP